MKNTNLHFILLCLVSSVQAEVKLHPLFADHAILQRSVQVPVWGTASPGEKVTVSFAGQTASATASADGKWRVDLQPLTVSETPQDLTATAANTVTIHDVLVGDVFLAGGQSNMGSPLSSGSAALALPTATDTALRFYTVTKQVAAEPLLVPKGQWDVSSPEAAKNFSAVAYFCAQEIRHTQKVPVAIINASWGGTPIKTWMSLESLKREPAISATLAEWETALAKHDATKDHPELQTAYLADAKDWETTVQPEFKAALKAHNAEMDALRAAGQPTRPGPKPSRPEPEAPDPIAMPTGSKRPSVPTISYNAMIAPLQPYALRGILWYQGEADGSHGMEYRQWLPRLIEGWRTAFGQGDLPFLLVQIPGNGNDVTPVAPQGMPWTREAQLMALKLPKTGMAVTLDIGDVAEVHPDNKRFVGERLGIAARGVVYGEKIVFSGPIYTSSKIADGKIAVEFDSIGSGLTPGQAPWVASTGKPLPTDKLVGFYIAGADKKWVEAEAKIEGNSVIVSSPQVSDPQAVRYGWANTPQVNLYNREGLPASPFRTDDWVK